MNRGKTGDTHTRAYKAAARSRFDSIIPVAANQAYAIAWFAGSPERFSSHASASADFTHSPATCLVATFSRFQTLTVARLSRSDTSDVENLKAWLTTVVARVCLDMLRSRKSRREESLDAQPPEPIASTLEGLDPNRKRLWLTRLV